MTLQPGTQQYCVITAGFGLVDSCTQDGLTPLEYGRSCPGSKYTATASSGAEIPTNPPAQSTTQGAGGNDTVY